MIFMIQKLNDILKKNNWSVVQSEVRDLKINLVN